VRQYYGGVSTKIEINSYNVDYFLFYYHNEEEKFKIRTTVCYCTLITFDTICGFKSLFRFLGKILINTHRVKFINVCIKYLIEYINDIYI